VARSGKGTETAADDDKQVGIELADRFLADPQNQYLRNELAVYCQERIVGIVRYLVLARGYHPPSESKYAFVEDACQDVLVRVLEKVGSLKTPGNLFAWLREVSFNLLVTEYRDAVGRGDTPRIPVDTEMRGEDGSPTSIFEVAEGRDAAIQHLAPSLTESVDAECWTEKIHDRAMLEKALAIHAYSGKKRDFESACWIKETWDYPDATTEQIAALRGRSVGDTQHILHHDNEAMIVIARKMLGLQAA
jgi:DNA-directed RNA polymerase specialized sigma24 family protein